VLKDLNQENNEKVFFMSFPFNVFMLRAEEDGAPKKWSEGHKSYVVARKAKFNAQTTGRPITLNRRT
jgi:hypothetical protein